MSTFQGNSQFPFQGNAPSVGKMKTFGLLSMSAIAPIGVTASPSSFLGAYNGPAAYDARIAELEKALQAANQKNHLLEVEIGGLKLKSANDPTAQLLCSEIYRGLQATISAFELNHPEQFQMQKVKEQYEGELKKVKDHSANTLEQLRNEYETVLQQSMRQQAELDQVKNEQRVANDRLVQCNYEIYQLQQNFLGKAQEAHMALELNGQLKEQLAVRNFAEKEANRLQDLLSLEREGFKRKIGELENTLKKTTRNAEAARNELHTVQTRLANADHEVNNLKRQLREAISSLQLKNQERANNERIQSEWIASYREGEAGARGVAEERKERTRAKYQTCLESLSKIVSGYQTESGTLRGAPSDAKASAIVTEESEYLQEVKKCMEQLWEAYELAEAERLQALSDKERKEMFADQRRIAKQQEHEARIARNQREQKLQEKIDALTKTNQEQAGKLSALEQNMQRMTIMNDHRIAQFYASCPPTNPLSIAEDMKIVNALRTGSSPSVSLG